MNHTTNTRDHQKQERAVAWLARAPPGVVHLTWCECKQDFLTVIRLPRPDDHREKT